MNNPLRSAYPGSRGIAGHVFRPVSEPRTYVRAIHLLAMFPLGIGYFVALVVLLAVGGSLIWTIPGVMIVLATIFISRLAGDFESLVVSRVANAEIRRPPWRVEAVEGWRSKVWVRLIDPTTWTGIVYLFVQFPIGIGVFVVLVVLGTVSGTFIAAPAVIFFTNGPLELSFGGSGLLMDRPVEAIWLVPVGLLMFLVTVHVVVLTSALHAMWARLMLSTRSEPRRLPSDPAPQTGPENSGLPHEPGDQKPHTGLEPAMPQSGAVLPTVNQGATGVVSELTRREREVLLMLARGKTNAEIADLFFISQGTVKTHVKRILAKLNLQDRTQVVIFAYETGIVTPSDAEARPALPK